MLSEWVKSLSWHEWTVNQQAGNHNNNEKKELNEKGKRAENAQGARSWELFRGRHGQKGTQCQAKDRFSSA